MKPYTMEDAKRDAKLGFWLSVIAVICSAVSFVCLIFVNT
jgi:hypothetical protein